MYEQDDATTGYDSDYDAVKMPNSDGMNLASLTQDGQQLATNALPLPSLTDPLTVGLFIGVPQDDQYTLVVVESTLSSVKAYLLDAEQQTRQLITPGFTYSFPLTKANTGGTYISSTRFSLVFENNTPLPVTLVAFTAQAQGGSGLLAWTTASEQQNAYFQVESSLDGTTFTALGRVAGAGTSPERRTYQFQDADLARYAAPLVYYRLRQVDTDGTSGFSPVRSLVVPAAGFAVVASPTVVPTGQALHLLVRTATAGPAWVCITDAQGRYLGQRALVLPAGTSTIVLPEAGPWAPGLYFVRVQQGAQQQVAKVVRQ
ncbi:MAG: T9SS type A sorting domain-containing protein [Hymenobacter sp.]|nr:MAG: T9SS type A sorting domain-containing protein [Hymenobacter sp.]